MTIKISKYIAFFIFGFALWLIETAAFGWNAKPTSAAEAVLDTVSIIFMFWGIMGDIFNSN